MNNKVKIIIIGLSVIGISIFSYNYFEIGKKAIPIWILKKEDVSNKVQITKVGILSEACNSIVFEISYNNIKNEEGLFYKVKAGHVATNNDYSGLRGDSTIELSKNNGSVEYKRWITPENKSSSTNKLWVQIDEVTSDGVESSADFIEIQRNKIWNNLCK